MFPRSAPHRREQPRQWEPAPRETPGSKGRGLPPHRGLPSCHKAEQGGLPVLFCFCCTTIAKLPSEELSSNPPQTRPDSVSRAQRLAGDTEFPEALRRASLRLGARQAGSRTRLAQTESRNRLHSTFPTSRTVTAWLFCSPTSAHREGASPPQEAVPARAATLPAICRNPDPRARALAAEKRFPRELRALLAQLNLPKASTRTLRKLGSTREQTPQHHRREHPGQRHDSPPRRHRHKGQHHNPCGRASPAHARAHPATALPGDDEMRNGN